MNRLATLPSVETILQTDEALALAEDFGRRMTLEAIRAALGEFRSSMRVDASKAAPDAQQILGRARAQLLAWTKPEIQPVINATGVILHTNLGRAPLSLATLNAIREAAQQYSSLEFDLNTGRRSDRLLHAETLLQRLTGAEAGMVVNNNAAAVLLALTGLAKRKRVLVARSQLVEIGGGFRMPDVMRQSGATLVEVGTTNRVRLDDYSEHFRDAGIVLRAHRSNFKMTGFVEEPDFAELVEAAHRAGLVVIDDLGSGALLDTSRFGLAHEPTVQESVVAGADLICFSGDKLLGGPQAGILIGKQDLIAKLRKHPLARAVRADKTCLAGLAATLNHYLRDEAEQEVPVWRMISMLLEVIRGRAASWAADLGAGKVLDSESALGGGSMPGESLPTCVLALEVENCTEFLRLLRMGTPPVVARAEKEMVLLDPRTVLTQQDEALIRSVQLVLGGRS
jgi:L-seryl-tRNA(Ser) seleniumtransferase